jgi:hypothetical protein
MDSTVITYSSVREVSMHTSLPKYTTLLLFTHEQIFTVRYLDVKIVLNICGVDVTLLDFCFICGGWYFVHQGTKFYSTIKLYHQELGNMLYFTHSSSPCMKDAFEQSWATNSLCEPNI